ncbi:MAG TPA: hypothetical protein VH082_08530 [Rudaea sp.]|nr:hypothetical protein [Rudaea sp.]
MADPLPLVDCRGLLCVDVAIDGQKPKRLLIDTGNVNSFVLTETADALGWKTEAIEKKGKTVSGIRRGGEHRVGLGDQSLTGKFLVFDRNMLGDNPPPIDGSLAYPFFKDRIVTIDYVHRTLQISDSADDASKAPLPGKLETITFGKQGPPILVGSPFLVNGKSVHAQIDTCFTGTLLVYDAALSQLGFVKSGHPSFFPDTDGGVTMLASRAKHLSFSGSDLGGKTPTIYFVGDGKNPVHQPDGLFEATVGNALFAHSALTFDFRTMTFDVKPANAKH